MSLLTIIQDVCGGMSMAQPSTVIGSSDASILQMVSLLNEAGEELSRDYNWQALVEEQTFATVAAEVQPVAVPADFDRFVPNSAWNRSTRRPVGGPLTSQEWQALKAQPALGMIFLSYRMRQGNFLVIPAPPVGQQIAYEYVSLNWVKGAGNVAKPAFTADADTSFLSERLLKLSLRWRYLASKGLPYDEQKATFELARDRAMARDGGSSILSAAPRSIDPLRLNVPDGNFGVP